MEANPDRENVSMAAASMQVDDSVKSRILERIKSQMDPGSDEPDWPIPPMYLKAPDDWP